MHFITLGCLIPSIISLARPLLTHIALQLLIIAHQGILRIIYAFYMGKSRAEAPYLSIPLNCVVELVPGPFDCKETVMHSFIYVILYKLCIFSFLCFHRSKRHVLYKPAKELAIDGQDEPNDPPSH